MEEESRSTPEGDEQTQANEGKSHAPIYEIGFHLVPTLTEAEVAEAFERMHTALATAEAVVLGEESPKKITLTYRIERSSAGKREKYTESYFGFIKFELPDEESADETESAHPPSLEAMDGRSKTTGEVINGLEGMLRGDSQVLRYLLIKTTREAPVAPKAIFSSRSLEGRTIERPIAQPEDRGEVDEGELNKSIEALVGDEPTA